MFLLTVKKDCMQYFKVRFKNRIYWFPFNKVVDIDEGAARLYYNAIMIYNITTGELEKCNPLTKFQKYRDNDNLSISTELAVDHYLELRGAIKPKFEDIMDDYIKRFYAQPEPEEINEDDK